MFFSFLIIYQVELFVQLLDLAVHLLLGLHGGVVQAEVPQLLVLTCKNLFRGVQLVLTLKILPIIAVGLRGTPAEAFTAANLLMSILQRKSMR